MKKRLLLILLTLVIYFAVSCTCNYNPFTPYEITATDSLSVTLVFPVNGAIEQATDLTFSWSGNAETYDVYLGTDSTNLSKIASNLTATTYTKSGLGEITTYYWKVVGTKGSDSDTSGVRKFITKINLSLEMVTVEAGTFQMGIGSAVPTDTAHYVTISKTFDIGKYEITNEQAVRVYNLAKKKGISGLSFSTGAVTYNTNTVLNLGNGACEIAYSGSGDTLYVENNKEKFPVMTISWEGATAFAEFMNNLSGTDKYRLPTEAEWEFAARGGKNSSNYDFAGSNTIGDVAWYSGSGSAQQVGQKQANELGIYDMSGNALEWCSDWYGNYSSSSQTDPTGAISGINRVLRGGSWNNPEDVCRVYYRIPSIPTATNNLVGFRLVRSK